MKRAMFLVVLLAGCTHTPPPAPPEIREVLVPTPVSCVNPANIPPEPPTVGQRFNGDAKHDLQILAPNARALRQWGQDLRALLDACTFKGPAELTADGEAAEPEAEEPKQAD